MSFTRTGRKIRNNSCEIKILESPLSPPSHSFLLIRVKKSSSKCLFVSKNQHISVFQFFFVLKAFFPPN